MSSSRGASGKTISFIAFHDQKVILVSRMDGNRGPLSVARAVNSRLAAEHDCELVEAASARDILKQFTKIATTVHDCSICIHANGYRVPMALMAVSRLNPSNRYYCVIHGIAAIEREYRPVAELDLKLEPKVVRGFPNIICVSDFEREKLAEVYGRRNNVTVIGNGVNLPAGSYTPRVRCSNPPVFITTGGFEQCKATDLALLVLTRVAKRYPRPKLIVCGRDTEAVGSNRALCEQIAREGGVDLVYEGEVIDKTRLRNLYASADFYIGLSRFDTFNVSVLEGAAAGCVPVVSNHCGASELFDKHDAVKVDIDDNYGIDFAEEIICDLILNQNRFMSFSAGAIEVAKRNEWDDVANRYWKVLSNGRI